MRKGSGIRRMLTKLVRIENNGAVRDEELSEAAQIIRAGGLVAFPTETVYGLGANALDAGAAERIYAAKGRPSDNPLIVHLSCLDELAPLVSGISDAGRALAEAYWPGPLTLIFPKSEAVPRETTGGLDTVAVRMPSNQIANRLIRLAGLPVAAPSANLSGKPSPTAAAHVWEDLAGKIEMIIDGGPVEIGVESTIVDVSGEAPTLLRPGAVTMEMLCETLGYVETDPALEISRNKESTKLQGLHPKAPGMKYRHYAPKSELILVEGDIGRMVETIRQRAAEQTAVGKRIGIICTDETRERYPDGIVRSVGIRAREETVAHNLFAVLREFDDLDVDLILSESFAKDHLGQAIMNRLAKAAGYHILEV